MNKRILTATLIALFGGFLISHAQTSQDPCPSGTPKCYSNLAPYAGHNLSASQLPPNLCPEGCAGDNRRVIVIRVDTSWGSTTNANIWNAVHCAAAAWNNATDGASPPNKIGYYFVVDQANLTNVTQADITVVKESPQGDLASCDVGIDNQNPNRQNELRLHPTNGDLGVGEGLNFNASDLCGRVAHELGHLIGVGEASDCRSIMFGVNLNGSRDVDTVQPGDVAQANRNFNSATRGACQETTPVNGVAPEPLASPSPTPTPPDCYDPDLDGYGEGFGCNGPDCDESNPNIHWGAYLGTCTSGFSIGFRDWNCNEQDDYYELACQSPVLLDIAGNGFELTSASDGVMFDIDGDGVIERLSWTSGATDDAWLALDRNGNGVIENGFELFGNYTAQPDPPIGEERNGFLALAEFDKPSNGGNGDRLITSADAIFSSLRVWRDSNHNGLSEISELQMLADVGLKALELRYKFSKKQDRYGNNFRYRAKILDLKSAQLGRWAWDVYLLRAP
ncbi:MAG TPA: hypothetical protein VN843_17640 [Anaerolineales bacterium]|nr:hypothetical protein [Anaerolineales bacterium]